MRIALIAACALLPALAAAAQPSPDEPPAQLATVVVAGDVEGFRPVPRHVPEADADTLRGASSLPDALTQALPGVALTHEQGNALQPSLRFEGFAASPLLGTPQGLSVVFDGVRVNEPFGDVVNWDLLPEDVIDSARLVPIADPVFGLNSLGGTVLLRSADGASLPGGEIGVEGGDYGHAAQHARLGGAAGDWTWLLAARNAHDSGWAPFSASTRRDLFAKVTRSAGGHETDLSFTYAQSRLAGSQTLPQAWMDTPRAIYTAPDIMRNRLAFINAGDAFALTPHLRASVRAWLRDSAQDSLNSNVNPGYDGTPPTEADPQAWLASGSLRQRSRGATLALRDDTPRFGLPNAAVAGLSLESQKVDYRQGQQPGAYTVQRYVAGFGAPGQAPVDLGVDNTYTGVYLSDRLALRPWLDVTLGGRWEHARIALTDRLGGALGGQHQYARLNPSIDLDLHPTRRAAYYLRYAEAMRAPMPVELTCASPQDPCTLPNVMVADPDLRPVIARTAQLGADWRFDGVRLQARYTQARLSDAIQFVAVGGASQGYFTNVPAELLRSLSLDLSGGDAALSWSASLGATLATYEADFVMPGPGNSSAAPDGTIQVRSGDRMPDVPRFSARLQAAWRPAPRWQLRGAMTAFGTRVAQGDENNRDSRGLLPGYAVFDLGASYAPASHWRVELSVHNLFDRVYVDFGQLGVNAFNGPGRSFGGAASNWTDALFVAPGQPRTVWLGVDYSWN